MDLWGLPLGSERPTFPRPSRDSKALTIKTHLHGPVLALGQHATDLPSRAGCAGDALLDAHLV